MGHQRGVGCTRRAVSSRPSLNVGGNSSTPNVPVLRVDGRPFGDQFIVSRAVRHHHRLPGRHRLNRWVTKPFGPGREQQGLGVPAVRIQDFVADARTHVMPRHTGGCSQFRSSRTAVGAGVTPDVMHTQLLKEVVGQSRKGANQEAQPLSRVVAAYDEEGAPVLGQRRRRCREGGRWGIAVHFHAVRHTVKRLTREPFGAEIFRGARVADEPIGSAQAGLQASEVTASHDGGSLLTDVEHFAGQGQPFRVQVEGIVNVHQHRYLGLGRNKVCLFLVRDQHQIDLALPNSTANAPWMSHPTLPQTSPARCL